MVSKRSDCYVSAEPRIGEKGNFKSTLIGSANYFMELAESDSCE